MAARRILILFVVLMGLGVLASSIAPRGGVPGGPGTTPTTQTRTTPTIEQPPSPPTNLVKADVQAPDAADRAFRPERIKAAQGDRVVLLVRATFEDQVQVDGYDLIEPVSQFAPAAFDFIADQAGSFDVRLLGADRIVARLVVTPPSERAAGASG